MPALAPATDQVLTFLAVLQHGSFSAAARALNRTQSSVTYAVQRLEGDLGITLLDRGQRRPKLTLHGKAVLPSLRRMAREVEAMQRTADGLARGLEQKLLLVVEAAFPMGRLLPVLRDFRNRFPTVPLRLGVEAVHAVAEALEAGTYMLGIAGPVVERYPALGFLPCGTVERIAVAAPGHPLAARGGAVPAAAFRDHVQIVLATRSRQPRGRQFTLPSAAIWRVNDMTAKQALLLDGLGWGRLPRHLAEPELAAGRLVRLEVEAIESLDWSIPLPLYVAYRKHDALGPAAAWMRDALVAAP